MWLQQVWFNASPLSSTQARSLLVLVSAAGLSCSVGGPAMSFRRSREVANPAIDVGEYLKILQTWHDAEKPWLGLCQYLEPQKAGSLRQVVPAAVVRLAPLLHLLLDGGLRNYVVYPSKWEAACICFAGQHCENGILW